MYCVILKHSPTDVHIYNTKFIHILSINLTFRFSLTCGNGNTSVWKTCTVIAILTVFQSYGANGRVLMKGCLQCNPVSAGFVAGLC